MFKDLINKVIDCMTTLEQKAGELFTKSYGKEFNSRIEKLKEEFNEFIQAYEDYLKRSGDYGHMIEELSDLQAVVTHISSILNLDVDSLLLSAILKSEIRKELPNYKRDSHEK